MNLSLPFVMCFWFQDSREDNQRNDSNDLAQVQFRFNKEKLLVARQILHYCKEQDEDYARSLKADENKDSIKRVLRIHITVASTVRARIYAHTLFANMVLD